MFFAEKEFKLKDGRTCVLRSARPKEDAAALIEYLKVTAGETRFILREPEEVTLTIEREEKFLQSNLDNPRSLMLLAFVDGEHAGNCSLISFDRMRLAHRCDVAIALYQKYCGLGIGRKMLETVLEVAKSLGFEQAELEVVADNTRAYHLYESLGFVPYGRRPHGMKYKDGTYADEIAMVKML